MNILENNIIRLRALEPEDIDILYKWENESSIWYVSNTLIPFSKFILKKYLENAHLDIFQAGQLRLIIEKKEKRLNIPVGLIDLFDFDPFHLRAGIGIMVHDEKQRKKGYATHALEIFIRYSFTVLGLHQIYCNISKDNKASLRLFRKMEFQIIGEKKDWLKADNGWTSEYMLQRINMKKYAIC